jgi:hypothetical protein
LGAGGRLLTSRQESLDDSADLAAAAGVDDAFRDEAGSFGVPDRVVRAVEEGVGGDRGNVATRRELATEVADHARNLHGNALRLARVLLDQARRRFIEKAALLLDEQQVPGKIDDGEVDLPVDRMAAVDTGPVHRVVDRIVVGQAAGEAGEGFDLALRGAGDGEFAPAVGKDAGHRQSGRGRGRNSYFSCNLRPLRS